MDVWGSGPFENREAADLLLELSVIEPDQVDPMLQGVLNSVIDPVALPDLPGMTRGVAAAVLVALALAPDQPVPAGLDAAWFSGLQLHPSDLRRIQARRAFRRAFAGDNPWYDVWQDNRLLGAARTVLAPYLATVGLR